MCWVGSSRLPDDVQVGDLRQLQEQAVTMRSAQIASVAALALLGMLGGCLILAKDGFTASNKRGGWTVFVPIPQAYVMAAIIFAMSVLAIIWLLREVKVRPLGYLLVATGYVLASIQLTRYLAQAVQ
jgi:hypothetical protein